MSREPPERALPAGAHPAEELSPTPHVSLKALGGTALPPGPTLQGWDRGGRSSRRGLEAQVETSGHPQPVNPNCP